MDTAGEPKATPAWHVLGAGAIGGLFAARLQRGGVPVTLILRNHRQLDDYRAQGLSIAMPDDPANVLYSGTPKACLPDQLQAGCIHNLLIATKAHQTQAAVADIAAALHPEAVIVLLQNGMGVSDLIAPSVRGNGTLLHAITTEGVWRRGAFELVHAGHGHTWIGAGHAQYPVALAIADRWREAGLSIGAEADIAPRLWRKLAVNCAINPFTALYRCRNGELPQQADWLQRRARVLDEVIALATASGYADALSGIDREVDRVVAATAANQSSMLQDVRAGRGTEIQFMNGFVAARSAAAGLTATENRALAEAIQALAAPA